MVELRKYDVSQTTFEQILEIQKHNLHFVKSIDDYRCGYKDRQNIYYDGKEYLVMLEHKLSFLLGKDVCSDKPNHWRQCIVRLINNQVEDVIEGTTGTKARNYINKILRKKYSNDEIKKQCELHSAEYDVNKKQVHFLLKEKEHLLEFENCYKYDINGAHNDALREIFPLCAKEFENMYLKRHEHPQYKAYNNYYVGMLGKHYNDGTFADTRPTYNWIVQRTTKKLLDAINKVGGTVLYANTDGFIVQNPTNPLAVSKELGDFKLEYQGNVRFYRDDNWYAYEFDTDDEDKRVVGNIRLSVRNKLDLKHRKIVHYTRERKFLNENDYIWETTNIREEII